MSESQLGLAQITRIVSVPSVSVGLLATAVQPTEVETPPDVEYVGYESVTVTNSDPDWRE